MSDTDEDARRRAIRNQKHTAWRARRAEGPVMEPAAPLVPILARWRDLGFADRVMAAAAGTGLKHVRNIHGGVTRIVHTELGDAIRGVTARDLWDRCDNNSVVPNFAAIRRVHALARLGWAVTAPGPDRAAVRAVLTPRGQRISYAYHQHIRDLYERLSGTPGESVVARRQATARGWAPPLAWEDVDIEDPDADPWTVDGLGYREREALNADGTVEDIYLLLTAGLTPQQVCDRIGHGPRYIEKHLERHLPDRPDLRRQFTRLTKRHGAAA